MIARLLAEASGCARRTSSSGRSAAPVLLPAPPTVGRSPTPTPASRPNASWRPIRGCATLSQQQYSPTPGEHGELFAGGRRELERRCFELDARISKKAKRGNAEAPTRPTRSAPAPAAPIASSCGAPTARSSARSTASGGGCTAGSSRATTAGGQLPARALRRLVVAPKLQVAALAPPRRVFGSSRAARAMLTRSHGLFTQRPESAAFRYAGRHSHRRRGRAGAAAHGRRRARHGRAGRRSVFEAHAAGSRWTATPRGARTTSSPPTDAPGASAGTACTTENKQTNKQTNNPPRGRRWPPSIFGRKSAARRHKRRVGRRLQQQQQQQTVRDGQQTDRQTDRTHPCPPPSLSPSHARKKPSLSAPSPAPCAVWHVSSTFASFGERASPQAGGTRLAVARTERHGAGRSCGCDGFRGPTAGRFSIS